MLTAAVAAAAVPALAMPAMSAPIEPHPEKPEGPMTVAYVEVNNHSIANVGDYTLEGTNAPVFDLAIIFAANINYDGENAYLHLNEQVTETLEDAENQIRPLQDAGIKVSLSILGNHQGAGFANFPDAESAQAFAAELADVVQEYDLDGIDFDDEWVQYGANDTGEPNDFSFVYLVSELRELLGEDKLITLYDIGPSAERLEYDGVNLGEVFDYAFQPYYGSYSVPDIPAMGPDQLAPGAIDLGQTPTERAVELAARTVEEGYGAIITYDLTGNDTSEKLSAITQELYGLPTAYQADPIPDTTRPEIELAVTEADVTVSASDVGRLDRLVANLYDADNSEFLQAIGSTSASTPLGTVEASQTWELPQDLAPGTYTVRASASDLAGNVKVTTDTFTIFEPVNIWASASAQCIGQDAYVAVNAANFTSERLDIRITTEYGEEKAYKVKPTENLYSAFEVGGSEAAAGTATIAGYYFAGGKGHYERFTVDYDAVNCA